LEIQIMPIRIVHLRASDTARAKLGSRAISVDEAKQLLSNGYETKPNPRNRKRVKNRMFLLGRTNGGRRLTVVVEPTADPGSWLIVTAWEN
jgi:hypothetical protein